MSKPNSEQSIRISAFLQLEDGTQKQWVNISRHKLLQIIHKYKPRIVGTDNVQEILLRNESMARFHRKLPTNTNIAQANITRTGKPIEIKSLFKRYNIKSNGKASPLETARGIVELINKDIGMIIDVYEDETLVKISQPRRTSKGGWSQSRYERQNEEVVLHAVDKVQDKLRLNDVIFDANIAKTKYGAKNAVFHTFLPREKILKIFKGVNLKPAKVKFISPARRTPKLKPLNSDINIKHVSYQRRIIVGIDPGTTVGGAVMDLRGKVLGTFSRREMTKAEIIYEVTDYGIPVAFCSDVSPIPNLVSKLAATFDAELYSPKVLLSKVDKRDLTKDYPDLRNNHEMDALSAAIKAYNLLKPKLDKVESSHLKNHEKDIAKALVIRGMTVADAIDAAKTREKRESSEQEKPITQESDINQALQNRIDNLLKYLAQSESTLGYLRGKIGELENSLETQQSINFRLVKKIDDLRDANILKALKDDLVSEKIREINSLRKLLAQKNQREQNMKSLITELRKSLWISLQEGKYPIKILSKFSANEIAKLERDYSIKEGDILLILDSSGGGRLTAIQLAEYKPRIVFLNMDNLSPEAQSVFSNYEIPIISAEGYNIQILDTIALIHPDDLNRSINNYNRIHQKKKIQEQRSKLMGAINDYRYERSRFFSSIQRDYDDHETENEV